MLEGVLRESPADGHAERRAGVLREQRWYPAPPGAEPAPVVADDLDEVIAVLRRLLDVNGLAVLRPDRMFTNAEYLRVARAFGEPQIQPDPELGPWVEDDVILNVRADFAETEDLQFQLLLAENYVVLHTELAGRPVHDQPRYLLFQCVEPPPRDQGGQTVLVPVDAVLRRLSPRSLQILRDTRHGEWHAPPPFIRRVDGLDVLAIRDPGGEPLPWRYDGDDASLTAADVEEALLDLITALYERDHAFGLHWERLLLLAVDNHRFLHGRTFGRRPETGPPRHLRQLKVRPAQREAVTA